IVPISTPSRHARGECPRGDVADAVETDPAGAGGPGRVADRPDAARAGMHGAIDIVVSHGVADADVHPASSSGLPRSVDEDDEGEVVPGAVRREVGQPG